MKRIVVVMGLMALAACTSAARPQASPHAEPVTKIIYSVQPCYGTCPVYSVTVSSDGSGVFEGMGHTAVVGERRFTISSADFGRFADHLAAVKPTSNREIAMPSSGCVGDEGGENFYVTDQQTYQVTWSDGKGGPDRTLAVDPGCSSNEAKQATGILRSAPSMLPIQDFIGIGKR